jgi:hypothetical protein
LSGDAEPVPPVLQDNWHGPDEARPHPTLLRGAATIALSWPRSARDLIPQR